MITLKSEDEIALMRKAGHIVAKTIQLLRGKIRPGISTKELDDIARDSIISLGGVPAFKDYKGFPANICTSINEEVVHGIPSEKRLLKEGDIISLDIGVYFNGYFADSAVSIIVGEVKSSIKKLLDVTRDSLYLGIRKARPGNHLFDISSAIQNFVEANGFSVVREFVGHGIGKSLHESPEIPNFGKPGTGPILQKGMVLAIEPMVNMGSWEVEFLDNQWTAITKDKLPSAHFEHTIAVRKGSPEILTM